MYEMDLPSSSLLTAVTFFIGDGLYAVGGSLVHSFRLEEFGAPTTGAPDAVPAGDRMPPGVRPASDDALEEYRIRVA
jgi:hypothetical protein